MATLRKQLEGKTREERYALIAQKFAELPTRTFTRGRYEVTLSDMRASGSVFSVFVVVKKDGVEVWSDTCQLVNPPFEVPDGTTRTEELVRPDGTTFQHEVPNLREDLVEALKVRLMSIVQRRV